MANRALTIVAKVKDAASAGLDKIQRSLRNTGQAAKKTSVDFTEFNRIMFTTSAFVGFFTKSFSHFGDTLLKGAELDRVGTQFERVLGPKGQLFSAIAGFTDNSIDKVEALRSAIQLKTLGIANSTSQVAELIARSGTAAKMAGIDSGEGIRRFTQFLKDGSVSNLEFLNLIRSADPALKTQLALVERMGGVFGGALSSQMKYNMGLRLLRAATNGALKGQRDLYDVIFDVKQSFGLLKNEVGIFLGTALSSLIDKITHAADMFTIMLEHIRKNKKEVLFLAKAFLVAASSLGAFMGTLGTLRLVSKGLQAVGLSATPLLVVLGGLALAFQGLTHKVGDGLRPVERMIERIRLFGAIIKGITQLVSSYLTNQDNFNKGIGQMDRELFELLNNNKLFVFVHNVSKAVAFVGNFVRDVYREIINFATFLDKKFGGTAYNILKLLGIDKKLEIDLEATGNMVDEPYIKRLSSIMIGSSEKVHKLLAKGAAALLGAFAAYKLFGIGKGLLSKIPIIGKFFASDSKKPTGTKNDPLHVKNVDGVKGGAVDTLAQIMLFKDMRGLLKKFPLLKNALKIPMIRMLVKPFLKPLIKVGNVLKPILKPLIKVGAVFKPIFKPVIKAFTKVTNIFKPIIKAIFKPFVKAFTKVQNFFRPVLKTMLKPFVKVATVLRPIFKPIFKSTIRPIIAGMEKFKAIFTAVGKAKGGSTGLMGMFNIIKTPFIAIGKFLSSVFKPVGNVVGKLITSFSGLSKLAAVARFAQILHLLLAAGGLLTGVIKGLIDNFSSFTGMFGAAYDYLRTIDYGQLFSDLYNSIADSLKGIAGFIGDTFTAIYDAVSSAVVEALAPIMEIGGFIYNKLAEGFGFIAPYIQVLLSPLEQVFNTFKGWLTIAGESLKAFYTWLSELPVVGELIKATVQSISDPFGTFKGAGEMVTGLAGMGMDAVTDMTRNATAKRLTEAGQTQNRNMFFTPETQEQKVDYAKRAIEQAQGADQMRMTKAYQDALKGTSAGGDQITREEWAAIFGFAMDNSKVAKAAEGTHQETKVANVAKNKLTSRRGGC